MKTLSVLMLCSALALSACAGGGTVGGTGGTPSQRAYRIDPADTGKIQFTTLDSINTLRSAKRLQPLALNAQLNAAAATHSRDMSVQNRPWHFGSDGSSPLDRVRRVGYTGAVVGELISESYDTELETLSAWMDQPDTRVVILDPTATEVGISWYQESNGKIWWTLITGRSTYGAPLVGSPGYVPLPQG